MATLPKKDQKQLVKTLGERLRKARELNNMTAIEAARRIGYANSSKLSKIENASDGNSVNLCVLEKAARIYGVSLDFLFGLSDDFEGSDDDVRTRNFVTSFMQTESGRLATAIQSLNKRINKLVKEGVIPNILAIEKTSNAFDRFVEINKTKFEGMRGGSSLLFAIEHMNESAKTTGSQIKRFQIECKTASSSGCQISFDFDEKPAP